MWAAAISLAVLLASGCRFRFTEGDRGDGAIGSDDAAADGTTGDDALIDSGPSAACTSAAICDGFESGLGSMWVADPMVSIDTTRAHRGTQSVKVHSPAFGANTGSYQSIAESQTITSGINPFYVRAWLWLSALPAFDNGLELMSAERPSSGSGIYVFVHADSTKVYSQLDTKIQSTATLVPTAGWFCLVWKVTRNTGTSGALELSGDVNVTLMNTKTDSSTLPLQYVVIGLGYSSTNNPVPQPAQDLWIDDVIVSATPVGCAD
jgi:hypothetical protein